MKVKNYDQVCRRLEIINNCEDMNFAKDLSYREIKYLSSKDELVKSFAYEQSFLSFLKKCFNFFMDDSEKLETCIDTLLLTGIPIEKLKEFGFDQILNNLKSIQKYEGLISSLNVNFGNFLTKKKLAKRVSFSEEKNQVRYYFKEEENLSFKHGGYNEKDKFEAFVLNKIHNNQKLKEVDWRTPEKLRIIEEEQKDLVKNTENNKKETDNKLFAKDLQIGNEINQPAWIPPIDYSYSNELPNLERVPVCTKNDNFSILSILDDPKIIHGILGNKDPDF